MNVCAQKISAEMAECMIRSLSHLEKEISSNFYLTAPSSSAFFSYIEELLKREIKSYKDYKKVITTPKEPVFHMIDPRKVLNDLDFVRKSIELICKKIVEKTYVTLSKKKGYEEECTFLLNEVAQLGVEYALMVVNINQMQNPFAPNIEKKEKEIMIEGVSPPQEENK